MNSIRIAIGELFQSSMSTMNFPSYIAYVNTSGKITSRSMMDLDTVILTFLEAQEKINQQNEENFVQIFEVLAELVKEKTPYKVVDTEKSDKAQWLQGLDTLEANAVAGPTRDELLKQQRIANLAKAREVKKAKVNPTV